MILMSIVRVSRPGEVRRRAADNKKPSPEAGFLGNSSRLGYLGHTVGLRAFLALYDLKFNQIALLKTFVALRLDGAIVNEYIRSVILADESKPFSIIKPFDCAFDARHLHTFRFLCPRFWGETRWSSPSFQNIPWGLHKEIYLIRLEREEGNGALVILGTLSEVTGWLRLSFTLEVLSK